MKADTARAFVYPVAGRELEVEQLEALIKAACHLSCEQASKSEARKCLKAADAYVVLICPELSKDPLVTQLAEEARRDGKRVIAVWAPGSDAQSLPAFINQYADAVIPMEPEAVAATVCGGEIMWRTPDGSRRPTPPTPRHKR